MTEASQGLIVIGENVNATRKIRATSPRVARTNATVGIRYTDLEGNARLLDCSDIMPKDPREQENFLIPHVAQALRKRDLDYLAWAIRGQERAGAQIIDLCVDEMSPYPEERQEWVRWLVRMAQGVTNTVLAIDSSDSETIRAGLEAHDGSRSRPAINSFNLEEGREALVDMAKEKNALLFANASGRAGMPHSAQDRIENLTKCMDIMDRHGISMHDRYLDPLVFPVGADGESANHYLAAVGELRSRYPEVHIFGGHSNVSFGLPGRPLMNNAFTLLAIHAGCDAIMIDPMMNSPKPFVEFRYATEALTARDEFAMRYIAYCRKGQGAPAAPKAQGAPA